MIHYSCDRCKRIIDTAKEPRYVLKIEAQAVLEPLSEDELEDDRDHLLEIHETLEAMDLDNEEIEPAESMRKTYDLCAKCYQKLLRDPLGTEAARHLGFSRN